MSLNTQSASLLPPPAAINEKEKLRSNRWLIAIAGSVLIVVAGLVGGFLYYFLSQTTKDSVPRASSDSPSTDSAQSKANPASYQLLGCYHDESAHALPISAGNSFNVQSCFAYAELHGYSYFGLEDGNECYVGNTNYAVYGDINSGAAVPAAFTSTVCQASCFDGSAGPCGGKWSLSVYELPQVAVQCAHTEFASIVASGAAGNKLVCLPCGANSESQGGQSLTCTCTAGYHNWVAGIGCSI